MIKKALLIILVQSNIFLCKAQNIKTTSHYNQLWFSYFNQTRFSNKWGMWLDLQLRTKEDFVQKFSQSIMRVGLTYYLNDAARLTAGYAYVVNYPGDNHPNVSQPEHRGWQQLQWFTNYSKAKMKQWIRLEERFRHKTLNDSTLAPGYNFNYKIRYSISYEVPIDHNKTKTHETSLVLNDEVHINFGKQIVYNYFDQNRFFAGLKLQANEKNSLQAGYMYLFQQQASGNKYKSINAIRLFYFHNLDVRKKIVVKT